MTSRDFCFWLQGFFELSADARIDLTAEQVGTIRRHLSLVFIHEIDPSMPSKKLDEAHAAPHPQPHLAPHVGPPGGPVFRC